MAARVLHFMGDSHLRPARAAAEAGLFAPHVCRFEEVGGATAVGLRHPTSRTQALARFRERLEPFDAATLPIFQLGEVDCGFVIWLRAQRHGESVEAQLTASLDAYRLFLLQTRDGGHADLIVTSATLPTIRDGQLAGKVALLRAQVMASYRDRTDLTLDYNARLAGLCMREGLRFVDIAASLLDPATRLLKEPFRHPDLDDHHLHPVRGGRLWAEEVLAALGG